MNLYDKPRSLKMLEFMAKKHDLTLTINGKKYPSKNTITYFAFFDNVAIVADNGTKAFREFGEGETPDEASENWAKMIEQKQLIIHADTDLEKRIKAPKLSE